MPLMNVACVTFAMAAAPYEETPFATPATPSVVSSMGI
jgi:hypothetical protein